MMEGLEVKLTPHIGKTKTRLLGVVDVELKQWEIMFQTAEMQRQGIDFMRFGFVGYRPGSPINPIPIPGMSKAVHAILAEAVSTKVNQQLADRGEKIARRVGACTIIDSEEADAEPQDEENEDDSDE